MRTPPRVLAAASSCAQGDVDLTIPPKHEYVLYCDLTQTQRDMYVKCLDKELVTAQGAVRLNNMLMQLRKVCNHPYLFDWPKDDGGHDIIDEALVTASAKMVLTDRILTRLKQEGGHQTLIFSQMTTQVRAWRPRPAVVAYSVTV